MQSSSGLHQKTLQPGNRLLRLNDVIAKTGMRKTTLYRWMDEGTFPASLPISHKSVGWLESEIDSWIQARLDLRNAKYFPTPGASS